MHKLRSFWFLILFKIGSRHGTMAGSKGLNEKNRPRVVFKFLGPPCSITGLSGRFLVSWATADITSIPSSEMSPFLVPKGGKSSTFCAGRRLILPGQLMSLWQVCLVFFFIRSAFLSRTLYTIATRHFVTTTAVVSQRDKPGHCLNARMKLALLNVLTRSMKHWWNSLFLSAPSPSMARFFDFPLEIIEEIVNALQDDVWWKVPHSFDPPLSILPLEIMQGWSSTPSVRMTPRC